MDEFKPNSHKSKEEVKEAQAERKKLDKVISGTAKAKKNEIRKFTDIFISEDISNVKSYILMDVLVPAIKKAVSDIVTNGIDMILYGGNGRTSKKSEASKISYTRYYDQRDEGRRRVETNTATRYSFDDIVVPTRGEAEEVISRMDELIESYGVVSVADFYDLVGINDTNYTNNRYGWTNIVSAQPVRVNDGYKIKLPKAMPIN